MEKGKLVKSAQPSAPFKQDTTARFALTGFKPVKGKTYTVQVDANVFSGGGLVSTARSRSSRARPSDMRSSPRLRSWG